MTRFLHRRLAKALRRTDGANMIEAAIVLPLILLLTFGTIEFASVFYVYLSLQNGVSQATRYAVTGNTANGASRVDSIKTAMRQATPTLTIPDTAFTFQHLPEGGTTWVGGAGGPNAVERVSVNYTWTFFTPLMRPFFPSGTMTIRVDSTMKNEARWQ
jgi:Flp pilus assembly protein TadG